MIRVSIDEALAAVLPPHEKPVAVILAGHNGSGKSTLWYGSLSPRLQLPLLNADRMMMSILPDPAPSGFLPPWARTLRDTSQAWMQVAQQGVSAFTNSAIGARLPFAIETVFSHWNRNADGSISSKIDLIKTLQSSGYFVLLAFVGLSTVTLSIARVDTRQSRGGHAVPSDKLLQRFPRTQQAIGEAIKVADASILVDNSRSEALAFTPVHIRRRNKVIYDVRDSWKRTLRPISSWLDIIVPR
ncbi:toxin [Massilia atriviolacea]|uniref:Toxin n=1 Tax=Massilia atriviolacea TaxID=2495579 RepID=A0A430HQZ0_9BURK|nr:zeta toxin family protein [Massilia atriviolacea]RSZ59940.1 toxin [Massilia atriviolacea]